MSPVAKSGVNSTHPVDQVLPSGQMFVVGLQHVLVMYAGAVAVPLIVGGALKLSKEDLAFLINADLFAGGLATLIQAIGFWKFGIRMPVVMGVTFVAVGPLVALANQGTELTTIFGAVIAAGIFAVLVAPFLSLLVRYFPPVVTGTVITIIGITLLRVGINWAGGGVGSASFGAPINLFLASLVLLFILLINKYIKGFFANVAVLGGLMVGFLVAIGLGRVNFAGVGEAGWVALVMPFRFGLPTFELASIISLCLVLIVVMVESTGMFLALGEICKRPINREMLTKGLRADGLGTILGGIFNTFPYTSFSQNVGLVAVTGVRSRWVVAVSGGILILLGLLPKMGAIVASIPPAVLGGAGIAMFGMVAATGIKILSRVNFENRHNLLIVAISVGIGMIPLVSPDFFKAIPTWTEPFTRSGITLGMLSAVLLNLLFNKVGAAENVEQELVESVRAVGAAEG